jgi:hypothetical protein
MPRKPGGKYKGKIGRAKGEATLAAELEAKRRKAYESNLARLQERRQAELLAEAGLMNDEEEEQAMKLAKIAQMFGAGKKGTLKKFWKNWRIGIVAMKKARVIDERKTCWRKSCQFCDHLPVKMNHRHGEFDMRHTLGCKAWWTNSLGRTLWGKEVNAKAAMDDRPDVVNDFRNCVCCGVDTGLTGLGCRTFHGLQDPQFMNASQIEKEKAREQAKHAHFASFIPAFALTGRSASTPSLRGAASPNMTLSAEENWAALRTCSPNGEVPEYDPTMPFVLSPTQAVLEERRLWSDELSAMAGSPWTRRRGGEVGLPALPPIPQVVAPERTDRGKALQQVAHWRTGQKTMLDKHMMKMYVVGTQ